MINAVTQSSLVGERFVAAHSIVYYKGKKGQGPKAGTWRQHLEAGTEAETREERRLLSVVHPLCCLIQLAIPAGDWHHARKCPIDLPTGQFCGNILLVVVPSSKMTLGCVKVTKTTTTTNN